MPLVPRLTPSRRRWPSAYSIPAPLAFGLLHPGASGPRLAPSRRLWPSASSIPAPLALGLLHPGASGPRSLWTPCVLRSRHPGPRSLWTPCVLRSRHPGPPRLSEPGAVAATGFRTVVLARGPLRCRRIRTRQAVVPARGRPLRNGGPLPAFSHRVGGCITAGPTGARRAASGAAEGTRGKGWAWGFEPPQCGDQDPLPRPPRPARAAQPPAVGTANSGRQAGIGCEPPRCGGPGLRPRLPLPRQRAGASPPASPAATAAILAPTTVGRHRAAATGAGSHRNPSCSSDSRTSAPSGASAA